MIGLLVAGVALLGTGLIGGYITYVTDAPIYFPVYMFLAFIGVLLAIIGIGIATHDDSGSK